jgi:DNA repair protein RecN (Recombination protein N)
MLQKLVIRNYAIIDHLSLEPDSGLNTITGETGAGKSIILGALSLILGERADTSVLINQEEKSLVEAHFDVTRIAGFRKALEQAELDYENPCIIRREISVAGKSRALINDTPVTLSVLNKIVSMLVDLHRQFGHAALSEDDFATDVLDQVGDHPAARDIYARLYHEHVKLSHQLADLRERRAQWQKESDYKQYLFDELEQAGFRENEIEDTEQKLKQLTHAERILSVINGSRAVLEEGETPLVNELKVISRQLAGIGELFPSINSVNERILSVWAELKDLSAELETLADRVNSDPGMLDQLQQRLDLGYKLLKKHSAADTAGLLEVKYRLGAELRATHDLGDTIDKLAAEEQKTCAAMQQAGEALSALRAKQMPGFTKKLNALLALVGMPEAQIRISQQRVAPGANGMDQIDFLLDANKSGQFQPVQKVASGGEMSRIMLCIKTLTANAQNLPTLIFDEVDSAISGEAARQVGILLRDLSARHQVICITHQPQVAARGTRHYFVYKEPDKSGRLSTRIRTLPQEDRVLAIARMIGGSNPSEAALNNARELVAQ